DPGSARRFPGTRVIEPRSRPSPRLPYRQHDAERRALPRRAVHVDAAMVLVDDAVGDRQAQPGAAADRLGGEERVEDALLQVGRDAAAAVLELDPHVVV